MTALAIEVENTLHQLEPPRAQTFQRLVRDAIARVTLPGQDQEAPPAEPSGLLDWLLACPEKDWFQPLPSDSTDTLG